MSAALVEALSSGQTLHELLRRRPEIAWLTYLDHSMRLVISCDICDMNAGSLYQTQSDTIRYNQMYLVCIASVP